MKVRISYTVDVPDDLRRAINMFHGQEGLATREDIIRWYTQYGSSIDDDAMHELAQSEDAEEQRREWNLGRKEAR